MDKRHSLGQWGESKAEKYLEAQGLRIVDRRFWTPYGEIDLIASDRDAWVFIEVRTRAIRSDVPAIETLTPAKQRRLVRAAWIYVVRYGLLGQPLRFDFVTIEKGKIDWIPNAFSVGPGVMF